MTNDIYISVDIKTDGPIPGDNSMLSIGMIAFLANGTVLGEYYANLVPHKHATPDERTMKWWGTNYVAYTVATSNQRKIIDVMSEVEIFISDLKLHGKPVFVAYPVAFDIMFVYWYLMHFTGNSPIMFKAIDIRSYQMGKGDTKYSDTGGLLIHNNHNALDDAKEQMNIFLELLNK